MEDFLPFLIAVALFFVIRFFKTKFRKLHFLMMFGITLYFIFRGIISADNRYPNLLIGLIGAVSVFSLFKEIKNQQAKS